MWWTLAADLKEEPGHVASIVVRAQGTERQPHTRDRRFTVSCTVQRAGLVVACWALLWQAATAQAAKPSETLLPGITKGYLSVPNFDVLEENWNKTQL